MNYLDFEVRVKLFKLFIVLNLLDYLSTMYCLNLGAVEVNPLLNLVLSSLGIYGLLAVKAVGLLIMHILFHHFSKTMLIILNVGMSAVLINNVVTMVLSS